MSIPRIDLTSLPGLDTATGLFGSAIGGGSGYDDKVVAMMVYIYDTFPPETVV